MKKKPVQYYDKVSAYPSSLTAKQALNAMYGKHGTRNRFEEETPQALYETLQRVRPSLTDSAWSDLYPWERDYWQSLVKQVWALAAIRTLDPRKASQ